MKFWSKIALFGALFILSSASPLKIEVSARSALLMNAETGAVLWEKNGSVPAFPASTTKMITALYAMEKKGGALDAWITASEDALSIVPSHVRRAKNGGHPPYRLEFGGTHMSLKVGEALPLRALLYGLMLCSGNDAANVIAEYVSGNVSAFMEELNRFVREKGCQNTLLYTPHGLPHEEHKTTAYDMALLAREYLKNPFLRQLARTTQYIRPQTNKQPESLLQQRNALVRPDKPFFYPKALGIKTGYTDAAGFTLVSAAEDENRKLIAVVFGCEKMEQRSRDAIALFEAGFNEKRVSRILFSRGFDLFSHQVEGGNSPLQAFLPEDVAIEYYPSEEPAFKTSVVWQTLSLPIAPHQHVGQMQVLSSEGRVLVSAPLNAVRGVEPTLFYQIHCTWQKAKEAAARHLTLVMAALGLLILSGTFYYFHHRAPGKER